MVILKCFRMYISKKLEEWRIKISQLWFSYMDIYFYMFVNASVAVDLSHALDGFQNECMKSDTISK